MSQNDMILRYLKDGKSITQLEAVERFNCFRLSARILDLIHRGYDIVSTMIERNGKHFARYSIVRVKKFNKKKQNKA